MDKGNKIRYVLIIISIILTLTGVLLFLMMKNSSLLKENIVVSIDGEISKTLKAEIGGLYPGKTDNYVISLIGDDVEDYLITLVFNGDNGGDLKNYIKVEIETNGSLVSKALNELLEGDLISLGTGVTEIKISYTMPIDVGNEAQGGSVVFFVKLEAKMIE